MSRNTHEATRREMARAVWRLNVLEFLMLAGIVLLAILGGALLAFLVEAALGFPFRLTWIVGAVLFLVVPGVIVLGREKGWRRRTERSEEPGETRKEDDG